MCMRRFNSKTREYQDVGYFVGDETEVLQLLRPWLRRTVITIEHHKYGSVSQNPTNGVFRRPCQRVFVIFRSHFGN